MQLVLESMSPRQIRMIKDAKIRLKLLKEYYDTVSTLGAYYPKIRIDMEKPLNDIYDEVMNYLISSDDTISKSLLPEDSIDVLVASSCIRSKKTRKCDFCGKEIKIGDYYIKYNPILIDKNTSCVYSLGKTLVLAKDCNHYLPYNVGEIEGLNKSIKEHNSFTGPTCNCFPNNMGDNVDFEYLAKNIGPIKIKKIGGKC